MNNNLDKISARILVLGDSGVGKSSLIHLLCHSTTLNSAQWTIGCSIDVKLHENYFLEFWDIGGSRGHKIARSFLYTDYHGIMLVFDATNKKSRLNLNEWLLEATQKTNDKDLETLVNINVPIITIATKKDLLPYGAIPDIDGGGSTGFKDDYCSVVNFSESSLQQRPFNSTTNPYRRLQSSSSSSYMIQPSYPLAQAHSSSASNLSKQLNSYQDESALKDQVIYVNTQDVLSFKPNSEIYDKFNTFFQHVIDKRNKKFYNKFAI